MPSISVIIPVKNQASSLRNAVQAVLCQTERPKEIIVVDGHSSDDISGSLSGLQVKLLTEDYGTRSGAIMVGLAGVDSEYVAFTDADCIPDQDWLKKLLGTFEPDVVGVGGTVLNSGSSKALQNVNAAFSSPLGSGGSVQGRLFKHQREVRSISGANSMYRLDALRKCGGYNVNLAGAEDAELNQRIRRLGRLVVNPNAIVRHHHGRGYAEFIREMHDYGQERVLARVLNIPAVVSILAPLLVISAILFFPLILFLVLVAYLLILETEGIRLRVARRLGRDSILIIPALLICEHLAYSTGIWRGLLQLVWNILRRSRPQSNGI
jgi:cellulose synthase/poly-beta-1,6-N-acetylglucosamine synthase-like glycosyltransferase